MTFFFNAIIGLRHPEERRGEAGAYLEGREIGLPARACYANDSVIAA